jgi:LEA14-like dessication related protein
MTGIRPIRFALPALLLAVLAGCNTVGKALFAPPVVTFQGVRLGSMSLNGAQLFVQLGLTNPNRFALSATHADYRLLVDDTIVVGQGQSNDTLSVGAHDSASVTLPIDVSLSELMRAGGGLLGGGTVNYRIVGSLRANTPIGTRDIPLNAKGRYSMVN